MPDTEKYLSMSPADREGDLCAIARMISDAFAEGGYVEEISKKYVGGCHYDFDTTRLIWEGDRPWCIIGACGATRCGWKM